MNEAINAQTFLILIGSVITINLGIIVLSIRSMRSMNKKDGLKKKILADRTVLFVDRTGEERIRINPKSETR